MIMLSMRKGVRWEGLDTKPSIKKDLEKEIVKHGMADAGSRLLFKFRSRSHGLNEKLDKYRG